MDANTAALIGGLVGGIGGGVAGGMAGFGIAYLQRGWDREHQRSQQQVDDEAARQAEATAAVITLWGAAVRLMGLGDFVSERVVQKWHDGELVGSLLVDGAQATGDLVTAYTRLFISGDDDLINAAWHVLDAAQIVNDSVGGTPWWQPWRRSERSQAREEGRLNLIDALHDLRELARTKLGRELPEIPLTRSRESN